MNTPPAEDYILCDFRIVTDTREQAPWTFAGMRGDSKQKNRPLLVSTVTETLATGDYSIEGMEGLITIERKSVADFYGTIMGGRDRFERELSRMQAMCDAGGAARIVVEGDWYTDIPLRPGETADDQRRRLKTVYRSVLSWELRFPGIHWSRWPGRRDAERYAFRVLERFWRVKQGELAQASKETESNG